MTGGAQGRLRLPGHPRVRLRLAALSPLLTPIERGLLTLSGTRLGKAHSATAHLSPGRLT